MLKPALLSLAALWVAAAAAAEPIRIGLTGPFTGGSSPMGISMRDGVRLAAAQVNAKGGVLGRPVLLVERDDQARDDRGAQLAQELVREKVVAVVGIVNTGVALASQRYYQEARIPVVTSVATGSIVTRQFLPPQFAENYVFRMSASDTIQAAMIVREAVERRRFTRVAIFHDSTNYGQLGRADLERALAERGIRPVAVEKFHVKDVDMTPRLLRARQAGAEAILSYGIGPELAAMANGMATVGWKAPMIGSWTLSMANFIDHAGPNAEGARMPQTFIQEPNTPGRAEFLEAYRKAYGTQRIPSPVSAAQGYDSMLVLAAAIRQAGSVEGPKIREALENLGEKVEGVVTTYERPFTRDNHEAITSRSVVMGEVRNGRVVYAYEEDRLRAARR